MGVVRPVERRTCVLVLNQGKEAATVYSSTTLATTQPVHQAPALMREGGGVGQGARCRIATGGGDREYKEVIDQLVQGTEDHKRKRAGTVIAQ